jgi:hypothetical protein
MIRLVSLLTILFVFSNSARAACPAAPVDDAGDRVIQFVQNGDGVTGIGATNIIDATEEGAVVYDATNNTLTVCDGTNWVALGGGGGEPLPTCQDGDGIIQVSGAWTCCGPNLEVTRPSVVTAGGQDISGDTNYIYTVGSGGIYAFTFDGSTLTQVGHNTSYALQGVHSDGTYIFASGNGFLKAFTFDGSSFSEVGSTTAPASPNLTNIITHNGNIIAQNGNVLEAFAFDGSSFSHIDSHSATGIGNHYSYYSNDSYIFVYGSTQLGAFSFDGTSFSDAGVTSLGGGLGRNGVGGFSNIIMTVDYVSNTNSPIKALSFDGTSFTELASLPGNWDYLSVSPDGKKMISHTWVGSGSYIIYDVDNADFVVKDSGFPNQSGFPGANGFWNNTYYFQGSVSSSNVNAYIIDDGCP